MGPLSDLPTGNGEGASWTTLEVLPQMLCYEDDAEVANLESLD